MLRRRHLPDDWMHELELLNMKGRQLTAIKEHELEPLNKQNRKKLLT